MTTKTTKITTAKKTARKKTVSTKRRAELKQIAFDMSEDKIFCSGHMSENERETLLYSIFMPLLFMDDKQHENFIKKKPWMLYEYLNKAGPKAINSYPIFMSMNTLYHHEKKAFLAYLQQAENIRKKFMEQEP